MVSEFTVRHCLDLIRPSLHRHVVAELEQARARSTGEGYERALRFIDQSTVSLRGDRPDTLTLFRVILERWDLVFGRKWSADEHRLIRQLKHARNRYAHEKAFAEGEIVDVVGQCAQLARLLGDSTCANACIELLPPGDPAEAPPRLFNRSPELYSGDDSSAEQFERELDRQSRTHGSTHPWTYRDTPPGAGAMPALEPPSIPRQPAPAAPSSQRTESYPRDSGSNVVERSPSPIRSALPALTAGLYDPGDDLADFFDTVGWRTVDKRSKGGCLWVIGDDDNLRILMVDLASRHGIVFQWVPEGGRASDYEPAWFTTNSA